MEPGEQAPVVAGGLVTVEGIKQGTQADAAVVHRLNVAGSGLLRVDPQGKGFLQLHAGRGAGAGFRFNPRKPAPQS